MNFYDKTKNKKFISSVILILIFFTSIIGINSDVTSNYPNSILYIDQITGENKSHPNIQDEYHTLVMPIRRLYGIQYDNIRVGPTTKLFTMLASPLGVLFMNSRLGGEHTVTETTHSSQGYNYIEKSLNSFENKLLPFIYDVNLQHFRYAILMVRNFIFLISIFLIVQYFYKRKYFISAILFLIFSTLNPLFVLGSLDIYTDITSYTLLNFIFYSFLSLKKSKLTNSFFIVTCLILLISNSIGNIFIFFITLLFLIYLIKPKLKHFLLFFTVTIFLYLLVNYNELSIGSNKVIGVEFVDQQLWNIWHYQTGHSYIEPSGFTMISKIISENLLISLFIFTIFFIRFIGDSFSKKLFLFSYFVFLVTLLSTSTLSVYNFRNLSAFYSFGIFGFILLFSNFENNLNILNKNKFSLFIFLSSLLIIFNINKVTGDKEIDYSAIKERYACDFVVGIDVSQKIKVDETIKFSIEEKILAKELDMQYRKILDNEKFNCLFVNYKSSNKFLSSFIIPDYYELKHRYKDRLFFVNKKNLEKEFEVR